jgi:selenide,water dikinase
MSINLLEFSKGGGCGCKIEPQKLHAILEGLSKNSFENVLVDFSERDDASVIDLNNGLLLVQTTDFFLPVVANPFDFGMIAAANAISDVYAMGAKPISALSILGWPVEKISIDVAKEVLMGASKICEFAGISISGGHSIESSDPIFGLSVSGLVNKQNLKRNSTCQIGDRIYLTKPLGLGLLANAVKLNKISDSAYQKLIFYATQLNVLGLEFAKMPNVNAMTDITGFGLLGHLSEVIGKDKGAILYLNQIPVIEEAIELANQMLYPNITTSNYNFIANRCNGLSGLEFLWLCDPQTSGGLLVTSSEDIDIKGVIKIGEITDSSIIKIL